MEKGIILYRSKYGATAKYAEWLAEETGFDLMQTKEASVEKLRRYDTIVLGGGIYASGIAGIGFLRKHLKQLQGKRLAVFCVGASPYEKKAGYIGISGRRPFIPAVAVCVLQMAPHPAPPGGGPVLSLPRGK